MGANTATAEPARPSRVRFFRNLRLAFVWASVAVLAAIVFAARLHALVGLASGAVALFALQAFVANWIGVIVRDSFVSVPRPVVKQIPVLTIWRERIPLPLLREATALGRFMGYDTVGLGTIDGAVPVLFASRAQKLAFFEAITAEKADIKIYRAF